MKNMHVIITILVFLFSCTSQSQEAEEGTIKLSGQVGFPQDGYIVLSQYLNGGAQAVPLDTINIKDDYTYEKNVKIPSPGYYKLDFYGIQVINLILDDEDVIVNVDGNDPQGFAEVVGSTDHDFIQNFYQELQAFQQSPSLQVINQRFAIAQQQGDSETMDSVRLAYMNMENQRKSELLQTADTMKTSLGVVEILKNKQTIDPDVHYDYLKSYAVRVKKDLPDSDVGQEFVTMVENMAALSIGSVAPEISLPNPEGEVIPLSSLRGHYVLVDFWAQWCRPCRMENPNIVAMYNKYNEEGFEVYGVSLDRTRDKWLQGIEEDGLVWTQVSDLKFWQSEAARTYNISAIPFSLLVDPEGKIIGKNLRGAALGKKLAEIYK